VGKLSQCKLLAQYFSMVMHGINKGKEGKRKKISSRERQDRVAAIGFIAYINLCVYFPCYVWHAWHCIWLFSIMAIQEMTRQG